MRIITGKARGVRLETLDGLNTRPTSERSKEAVFSALQFEIADRVVLDLFSGSGQMGLEAASRGAARVYLVDKSREAFKTITGNIEKTRLADVCVSKNEDSISFLKRYSGEKFGIVFLDPPYATNLICEAIKVILERDLLEEDGILVCESDRFDILDLEISKKCDIIKTMKHGVAHISVIKLKGAEEV
jgi:16S rRNA (guanine966-N2)-methyltransferase